MFIKLNVCFRLLQLVLLHGTEISVCQTGLDMKELSDFCETLLESGNGLPDSTVSTCNAPKTALGGPHCLTMSRVMFFGSHSAR